MCYLWEMAKNLRIPYIIVLNIELERNATESWRT
jgi:hypothetical protein